MGAMRRLVRFGRGSLIGAGLGTAAAILFAPQSGDELKGRFIDRLREVRLAGAQAKAAKENELIQRFRAGVEDPEALRAEEEASRLQAAQMISAIGLGLNSPGALAAQEPALREDRGLVEVPVLRSESETKSTPE